MGKLEVYAVALLVAVLACVGAYFYGRHDGTTVERAKWEAEALAAKERDFQSLLGAINTANQIGKDNGDAIKGIRVTNKTINTEVQREIKENVIYASECFAPSGLLLWNASNRGVVSGGAAAPSGDGRVPAAAGKGRSR